MNENQKDKSRVKKPGWQSKIAYPGMRANSVKAKKRMQPKIMTLKKRIEVRLDYKTVLIINGPSSFVIWKRL